ncbi:MAG: CRISPR-associated helicase Cas3' [Holophaga sp.]|nr:CRISPR-associated helicase Cas3' [Holophaga sp.]
MADGQPGISVCEHMLNVGCVAQCLAEASPELLARFKLPSAVVGSIAALHDLGKISPGFQRKCPAWLAENGLVEIDRNCGWSKTTESSHAKVTHAAVQKSLVEFGSERGTASCIATLLGAHHGRIQSLPDSRPFQPNGTAESRSGILWEEERERAAKGILQAFDTNPSSLLLAKDDPSLWWLAGLTTVADWIGSDELVFPTVGGMQDEQRSTHASEATRQIGFAPPSVVSGLGFAELFGFPEGTHPNDMQIKARELIQGPGVYVIEAPMGIGKTEAALWVAYELMATRQARGIYFALPTQATSNRIHIRMSEFVKRIAPSAASSRLIHGHSWMMSDLGQPELNPTGATKSDREDARVGSDWFASAKRSLLAPFGVGTIDQALLGVVAAKHFFVRRFALAGKVVILDEVHSYDLYTGTLIDKLVEVLRGLGCTVIILSATLTGKRRNQLVPAPDQQDTDPTRSPYPLISGAPETGDAASIPCVAPPPKHVEVQFQQGDVALSRALELASQGGVVLWICNTVHAAQEWYARAIQGAGGSFPIGLLHSRFPFWRRNELENEWMTRLGKEGQGRCGCILVSTQIVEQSVDLDADLMITELAPTDMLFQRMGRLWRHERPGRVGHPSLIILEESMTLDALRLMGPKAIVEALGAKAFVYSPYVLLRSLEVWISKKDVILPDQIRPLIEATYAEQSAEFEPEGWKEIADPASWEKLFDERYAMDLSRKFLATRNTNIWQQALDDVEGTQTRLNEMPTVQLVLCQVLTGNTVEFLDAPGRIQIQTDRFHLESAMALHRNVVKVPRHIFATVVPCEVFQACLYGEQTVGRVVDGQIQVEGLKQGVSLRWSNTEGVVVVKASKRSQA